MHVNYFEWQHVNMHADSLTHYVTYCVTGTCKITGKGSPRTYACHEQDVQLKNTLPRSTNEHQNHVPCRFSVYSYTCVSRRCVVPVRPALTVEPKLPVSCVLFPAFQIHKWVTGAAIVKPRCRPGVPTV